MLEDVVFGLEFKDTEVLCWNGFKAAISFDFTSGIGKRLSFLREISGIDFVDYS